MYEKLQKWLDAASVNGKRVSDYFSLAAVNGMKHREITNKAKIMGFPTLLLSDNSGEISEPSERVITMFSDSGPVNEIHFILDKVGKLMGLSSEELSQEKAKYKVTLPPQIPAQKAPKGAQQKPVQRATPPAPQRGGFRFTFNK